MNICIEMVANPLLARKLALDAAKFITQHLFLTPLTKQETFQNNETGEDHLLDGVKQLEDKSEEPPKASDIQF